MAFRGEKKRGFGVFVVGMGMVLPTALLLLLVAYIPYGSWTLLGFDASFLVGSGDRDQQNLHRIQCLGFDLYRLLFSAYGRTPIAKVAVFAAVLAIGGYNRYWLVPQISDSTHVMN
jgi:hypothetical protein